MPSTDRPDPQNSSTSHPGGPDLVIFDCDGVLVDTERVHVAVEARLLTAMGWPHTPEEVVARFMGRSSADGLAEVAARLGEAAALEFDRRSTLEADRAFDAGLSAVPGVEGLVRLLHAQGVATCVASSGTHEKMRRTLGLTGLHEHFDGRIYSATEVPRGKPAPDLFLHAAGQMRVDPSRCVVVEDSVYGVRAAVAAGMTAYGYVGGLVDPASLAAAGAVLFDDMAGLVDVLLP